MLFWHIFLAFFIPGILGYGGGPASIPLIENEVVDHYHWMKLAEFSHVLAVGNALPGPIATKMAGYIGYEVAGVTGAFIALLATVAPSLILMIVLLNLLYKYRNSPKVKRLTMFIRPTIAVLLGWMAYDFFADSYRSSGWIQMAALAGISFVLMEKVKVHPAIVIMAALVYGAFFMAS